MIVNLIFQQARQKRRELIMLAGIDYALFFLILTARGRARHDL